MTYINASGDLETKLDHRNQKIRIIGTQYPAAMITDMPNLPLPYVKQMYKEAEDALKSMKLP